MGSCGCDRGRTFDPGGGPAVCHWHSDRRGVAPAVARTGDVRPGRQGQPEGSKLDPHEDFILGLVEEVKDISLAEIAARLAEERGLTACPATIWYFFDKRRITHKKRRRTPANSSARM